MGCYEYGSNGLFGFMIDKIGIICMMNNSVVKIVNFNGGILGSMVFSYVCNNSINYNSVKIVNGVYLLFNDVYFFGKVVFDMY